MELLSITPDRALTFFKVLIFAGPVISAIGGFCFYQFNKQYEKTKEGERIKQTTELNGKIDSLVSGNNILITQLEPFIEQAKTMFPSDEDSVALEKLREKIEKTKNRLDNYINTITSLESEIKITFTGKWKEQPFPNKVFETSPVNQYMVLSNSKSKAQSELISFFGKTPYEFETIDDHTGMFISTQTVKHGSLPIGKDIESLKNLDVISIFIPFIMPDGFVSDEVIITHVEITLHINNETKTLKSDSNYVVQASTHKIHPDIKWVSFQVVSDNIIDKLTPVN